jgi:hypothetical protein
VNSRASNHVDVLTWYEVNCRQSGACNIFKTKSNAQYFCTHTNRDMRIRSDFKFPNDLFGWHACLFEMTSHLLGRILVRLVRSSYLHSVIFRIVFAYCLNVCCHLTMLELTISNSQSMLTRCSLLRERTWRTVTGYRAPWSSHIDVIPRLRAMRPVRTEVGVHFAGAAGVDVDAVDDDAVVAVALAVDVVCSKRAAAVLDCWRKVQTRSMADCKRSKRHGDAQDASRT